jgi:2-polyprenyl-6-methoxyphenol hydroxylase-like FAD-dependent oxidoreductase
MTVDAVVVGGGPTGLMLACELRLAGVHPVVLERLDAPSDLPKANGLVGRVVELLDYRGLLERFSADAPFVGPTPSFQFGSLPIDLGGLDSSPLHILPIPQAQLERLLAARAHELGVEIRRGHELIGLSQDGDVVTAEVETANGDYQLQTSVLIGCDGAHSLVRKLSGIAFPGTSELDALTRLGHVNLPTANVDPESGEVAVPGLGHLQPGWTRTAAGMFAFGSFQPGIFVVATVEWGQSSFDRDTPMSLDELRASAHRVLGADLPMSQPRWLSRLTGNSRQADRYSTGRVFLAGDAAHVFAGPGGPALNVGLLDAVNLGWKVGAMLRGWAPTGLLDTYHSERHPVGARTLMHTRAQSALMDQGEEAEALRQLFAELLAQDQVTRCIGELLNGSDIRYDTKAAELAPHPLAGRWAPDISLVTAKGRSRVAELMHPARPVLLDLTGGIGLAQIAAGWTDRIDIVAGRADGQPPPATAMLIRPDGYVAWATSLDELESQSEQGLRHALRTWFGNARIR